MDHSRHSQKIAAEHDKVLVTDWVFRVLYATDKAMTSFADRLWRTIIEGLAIHAMSELGGSVAFQFEDTGTSQTPAEDDAKHLALSPVQHTEKAI